MRVLKLVPVFLLFLLLGGLVLPLPGHATHKKPCCACGTCNQMCTCRGTNPHCPYCRTGDSDTFQVNASTGRGTLDIRKVGHEPRPFNVMRPDVTARLVEFRKRVRGHFTLNPLGDVADGLKFGCSDFDEKNIKITPWHSR